MNLKRILNFTDFKPGLDPSLCKQNRDFLTENFDFLLTSEIKKKITFLPISYGPYESYDMVYIMHLFDVNKNTKFGSIYYNLFY